MREASLIQDLDKPVQCGSVSVVIPVWRDGAALLPLIRRLRDLTQVHDIIISAAEPRPHLREDAEALGAKFLENPEPNRGQQLNRGAEVAQGDWLLFHHADSVLQPEHLIALATLRSTDAIGGAFYRKFDERHPNLRWLEKLERLHCQAFGTLYADQSIFVRRDHFRAMTGFASIPLMEDVEFSARLRRSGRVKLLDPPMRSSARKQVMQGAWRVTMRNLLFLLLFRCGVSGRRLHVWYYAKEQRSGMQWAGLDSAHSPYRRAETQAIIERGKET